MAWNTGNTAEVHSWECIGLDANERQLAEKLVEEKPEKAHPDKPRSRRERHEEGFDLYAHESHRWSPVSHYLEPYL